jgi:hypothetical protein
MARRIQRQAVFAHSNPKLPGILQKLLGKTSGNSAFTKKWLSDMDSNHDKSLQRALCYRYTIGQL